MVTSGACIGLEYFLCANHDGTDLWERDLDAAMGSGVEGGYDEDAIPGSLVRIARDCDTFDCLRAVLSISISSRRRSTMEDRSPDRERVYRACRRCPMLCAIRGAAEGGATGGTAKSIPPRAAHTGTNSAVIERDHLQRFFTDSRYARHEDGGTYGET
jgi:hypothetical protein